MNNSDPHSRLQALQRLKQANEKQARESKLFGNNLEAIASGTTTWEALQNQDAAARYTAAEAEDQPPQDQEP